MIYFSLNKVTCALVKLNWTIIWTHLPLRFKASLPENLSQTLSDVMDMIESLRSSAGGSGEQDEETIRRIRGKNHSRSKKRGSSLVKSREYCEWGEIESKAHTSETCSAGKTLLPKFMRFKHFNERSLQWFRLLSSPYGCCYVVCRLMKKAWVRVTTFLPVISIRSCHGARRNLG